MAKTSMKHPITGWLYEIDTTGLVRVSDPQTGRFGLFDSDGGWHDGEIRDIDLQIVGWIGRTPLARERLAAQAVAQAAAQNPTQEVAP